MVLYLVFIQSANALQPSNVPGQFDANTRVGQFHNVVVYAPMPTVRANVQILSASGVYVVELVNGNVEDVRVLKSTGYKVLDDAAVATLRQWRFKPHIIYKATIPIQFRATKGTAASKK
jgi:TonB family protein